MGGLPHHGVMKDDYLMIKGCCVGPKKRIVTRGQTLLNQTSRVALEEIKLKGHCGDFKEAMEARLHRIEELVGKSEQPSPVGLIQQISALQETVENLKMRVKEELQQFVEKGLVSVLDEISCLTDADFKLEALRAVRQGCRMRRWCLSRVCISLGMLSCGGRSRLSDDANANRERIETSEVLKKELNDQFHPCNTSWIARESLRNLKHTGTRNSGEDNAKFGKKFKNKEKTKKVVTETFEPRAVERPRADCFICGNLELQARDSLERDKLNAIVAEWTDNEWKTELARVGAVQLGTLENRPKLPATAMETVHNRLASNFSQLPCRWAVINLNRLITYPAHGACFSPHSQPPSLGRCRQLPTLPTVCARCQARQCTCLHAESYCTLGTLCTNRLPVSESHPHPCAPCALLVKRLRTRAHARAYLLTLTTNARPVRPPLCSLPHPSLDYSST
ncbi:UNVERIFIED_CONTAM: 60S ribosomal protein L3-1 [Sesamum calycinum]|uniref:60S ribosomal protein L3-1 n=1 Tax=Sesamum calycinum TaxID=2727403 RepID=A0AAW2IRV4_9LAMI